ncbi:MAG: hypothetical protein VB137_02195 [Burkholderia sp.]
MASTAHEALIAELLGDVGKLHDEIKALPGLIAQTVWAINGAAQEATEQAKAAVRAAGDEEADRLRGELAKVAKEVLQDVHRQAAQSAPDGWKIKVALALAGLAIISALAGGVVGAWLFSSSSLSAEEQKQLQAGKDILRVWPQLDEATKNPLTKLFK